MTVYEGADRRVTERRRHAPPMSLVGPYLAIAAVVIAGFFVQGRNGERIEREGKERDAAICHDSNERATGARAFVLDLATDGGRPVPVDQARRLQVLLDKRFPIKDCDALVNDKK